MAKNSGRARSECGRSTIRLMRFGSDRSEWREAYGGTGRSKKEPKSNHKYIIGSPIIYNRVDRKSTFFDFRKHRVKKGAVG